MYINIAKNADELGKNAAEYVGAALKDLIARNGYAGSGKGHTACAGLP